MNSKLSRPIRCLPVLCIATLFGSGCSGSGTSNTDGIQLPVNDGNNSQLEGSSEPPTPDPVGQISTRINFSITVPAYQSTELQVQLTWDDKVFNANWVGDELWTVYADFPINTEHELLITFSDANGDLTLAQYVSMFRSGTNESESYQVSAEQFSIEAWDRDNDGVSNLAESLAGTNPHVNENALLDVRDTYFVNSIFPVSEYYEVRIPDSRPYFEYSEEFPTTDFYTDRRTHVISININELGTGSISDRYRFAGAADRDITIINQDASRTNSDNSIIWVGNYKRSNSGSGVANDIAFTVETKKLDQTTFLQTGHVEREETGVSNGIVQSLTYSLAGSVGTETTLCEPTSGTVTNNARYIHSTLPHTVATISKTTDDSYWAVSVATPDGEILENYSVRTLSANFYCSFSDLQ